MTLAMRKSQEESHSSRRRATVIAWLPVLAGLSSVPLHAQPSSAAEAHAREGFRLASEGRDIARAEEELRHAVRLDPGNAAYRSALGGVLAVQRKFDEAAAAFEEALRMRPGDNATRRNLAAAQWQLGRLDLSESNLERVLAAEPTDQAAALLLGIVSAATGQCIRSIRLLESVMPLVRQRPEAATALATCYFAAGRHREGNQTLGALSPAGAETETVFQAGVVAAQAQDFETALQLFAAVLDTYGDRPTLLYNIAYCQYRTARFSEARDTLREIVRSGQPTSEVLSLLGWSHRQEGQFDAALNAFRAAIEIDPENEANYLDLATALMDDKRNPAALSVIQASLRAVPGSVALLKFRGLLEMTLGHYLDAARTYQEAAALQPDSANIHLNLALSQAASGDLESSFGSFEAGMRRFPHHAPHHLEYGRLLLAQRKSSHDPIHRRAAALIQKAVELDPAFADARYEAGKIALEDGDPAQALRHLESAAESAPGRSKIHHSLARAYGRLGREEDARKARERFLELKAEEAAANPRAYGSSRAAPTPLFDRGRGQ